MKFSKDAQAKFLGTAILICFGYIIISLIIKIW
jgi:hypothetical protein